ncbi:uncharacterized protein LOC113231448 isoform X2 [Hyposmocoma kahamanoa]|uniref:uncharacterized protein LOC113231448 isoform X2 n=1 Tax=Hyposmocoma kahamanoa TaxID=1477025 RepID=UPI000E6D7A69|nr:uncharacterized protein LOC113231448 isoform X2 [Hyposmocoma kahamanoa]
MKTEPILFCLKVCPLYCHPRSKRDVDMSEIYLDDDEGPWKEHWHDYPPHPYPHYPHYPHYIYICKQPVTTTTMKPVTTTEEPTYICSLCKTKCDYPPTKK